MSDSDRGGSAGVTESLVRSDSLACRLPAETRVKVIGLGGVGSIVAEFLALFLRSLGRPLRLVLIDGDEFEPGNAQRMKFETLGNKAEVKGAELSTILAGSAVGLLTIPEYIGVENLDRLINSNDVLFLCLDNHPSRRLISEYCERLENVTLFSGGNDGVEPPHRRGTYGNVQVHVRDAGQNLTMPITQMHPEIRNAEGGLPGGPDCTEQATSSPQILMANLAVASHMMNAFYAWTCGELTYQEVQFDILEARAVPCFPLAAPVGVRM